MLLNSLQILSHIYIPMYKYDIAVAIWYVVCIVRVPARSTIVGVLAMTRMNFRRLCTITFVRIKFLPSKLIVIIYVQ